MRMTNETTRPSDDAVTSSERGGHAAACGQSKCSASVEKVARRNARRDSSIRKFVSRCSAILPKTDDVIGGLFIQPTDTCGAQ